MLISELIENLEREKARLGDVKVTMTGTFLPDGFKHNSKVFEDVFESTVESMQAQECDELGKHLRLYWQT